jgi:hypothetical protein
MNGFGLPEMIEEGLPLISELVISYAVVGAFIAWHRPRNVIGWLFIGAAFFQGLNNFTYQYAQYALVTRPGALPFGAEAIWLAEISWAPGLASLLAFLPLLFPDGRPPSPRWWPVAWLGVLSVFMLTIPAGIALWPFRGPLLLQADFDRFLDTDAILIRLAILSFPLLLVSSALALLALGWRFRCTEGIVRTQIKWFLLAGLVTFTGFFLSEVITDWYPQIDVHFNVTGLLVVPALPLAAALAILRYRLYDIDVIIRKTLLYSLLTTLLALVYFGSVILLQELFTTFTGEQPTAAIVLSTLLIAALFTPLRQRLQQLIDRRFFRRKYDAERVLAQFAATARNETDIDRLTAELVQVVQETMQPAHVSVWLRPTSNH